MYVSPPLNRDGSHAERVVVDYRVAAKKPESLSHVEAAALPLVLLTAWEAMYDMADVRPRMNVLIHAAAGGVGHVAVQLAKARGCTVIGTASSDASFELLRSLGIDHVIDYKQEDVTARVRELTDGRGADAVFDFVGGDVFGASVEQLAVRGRLTTIVGVPPETDLAPLFLKSGQLNTEFMGATALAGQVPVHQSRILNEAAERVAAGSLRPHVSATFPLEELAAAHELQETRGVAGKVVIVVKE